MSMLLVDHTFETNMRSHARVVLASFTGPSAVLCHTHMHRASRCPGHPSGGR
jgi:hypothetical protein